MVVMRSLQSFEKPLVLFLGGRANIVIEVDRIEVIPINDGGTGSPKFCTSHDENRRFGKVASECKFWDVDDMEVSAALILDQDGKLFELDVFKSDLSPLLRWPTQEELHDANIDG
ncbi:MAG: hypothetical protein AAFR24_14460 [Cyanobacteria bacterium J06627_3]